MPTYDYRCDTCKKTYELRESFSAPMEHTCEQCGKGTAKRQLSAPRIVFKGSGFYATDSRSKTSAVADNGSSGSSDDSKAESASTSSSETSSTSSTETASAAS